jgi:hypothetical protein
VCDVSPEKDLVAYCDLYCGDCAGHSGDVAEAAASLCTTIEAYAFARTAACVFAEEIPHYGSFREVLDFLAGLRCEAPCRARDAESTSCAVRACCIDKGHFACHECDTFATCATLRGNVERCGYASIENIRAIREIGFDAWPKSERRRWFRVSKQR